MESVTPYKAAQIVNSVLAEQGLEKRIPPQMMYNYVRNGILEGNKDSGSWSLSLESLGKWIPNYIGKIKIKEGK